MERIAILILAHKNENQIKRLIRALSHDYVDIYIHLDSRFGSIENLKKDFSDSKQVFFIKNRQKCYLNTYSLVDAIFYLIENAYHNNGYKYYILLSGQDYPIKPMNYIYNFLLNSYPREFLDYTKVESGTWCETWGRKVFNQYLRTRLFDVIGGRLYFSKIGSYLRAPIKLIIDNIETILYGKPIENLKKIGLSYSAGSMFWMLTDDSIKYILDKFKNNDTKEIISIFKRTQTPEECFFQTILAESPFIDNIKNIESFKNYSDPNITRMDRSHILRFIFDYKDGVHSGHPYNIRYQDFDLLINANSLFARKFDENYDREILDMIDEHIKIDAK